MVCETIYPAETLFLGTRGTNLHVQTIISYPDYLLIFLLLETEVVCDIVLTIFIEYSNEPYITSIADQVPLEAIGNSCSFE